MTNLTAQIAKDLPQVLQATETNIEITRTDSDFVLFNLNGDRYSARLTKTGKVKKYSTCRYDSY